LEELPSPGGIGPVQAADLLAEMATIRRRVRRPLALWPPLVVFGVVAVLGAPLGIIGALAMNVWWFATAPVAFAAVGRYTARHGGRRGIYGHGRLLTGLGLASFAAGWVACLWLAAVAGLPGELGWALTVAAGYLAWSWFAHSPAGAGVAVILAATGTALALSPAPGWTTQLGVGLAMIISGLLLRTGPEAP
jgi:hypothetical protein